MTQNSSLVKYIIAGFYACVRPIQNSAQTTNNPGVYLFTAAYTFAPNSCTQEYIAQPNATGSSEIAVSWNRDSLGGIASQIIFVRPSADVTAGGIYFVWCNVSSESITIPAGAQLMYQVLN